MSDRHKGDAKTCPLLDQKGREKDRKHTEKERIFAAFGRERESGLKLLRRCVRWVNYELMWGVGGDVEKKCECQR